MSFSRFQGRACLKVRPLVAGGGGIHEMSSTEPGLGEANGGLSESLVTVLAPTSAASEAYRIVKARLLYALRDAPMKVIVVTSPCAREGKSTTCANLAVVLAQAGKNTLVMDCDLRNPVMHKFFGVPNLYGVVDALVYEDDLPGDWWQKPMPRLKVATVGLVPPDPTELVGSRRFADLLRDAREMFDYVLIDAPPVGPLSDWTILATQADGVLLVLDAHNTRRNALREAVRSLESVGARILGTVTNKMKGDG